MSALTYYVQHMPDDAFWQKLSQLPLQSAHYPEVLTLAGNIALAYSPYNAVEGYADFQDPKRALHLVVPPTPSPINSIGFLFGLPQGMSRRVYVAFFYGVNQGVLAECGPMVLLHKPVGLRLKSNAISGAVYTDFTVADKVLKGDDAPICQLYASAGNPNLSLTLQEKPDADGIRSFLDIQLRVPMVASMAVNSRQQPVLPI
jgi:hypothetical protein